ncbi:hypothetical protein BZA05DRAFT_405183 [Tricharina praecox]|uniref:uncharacterized protein n=1 Tax=Tricharina praecox TaxID=43433 RepID=UPI00221F3444|nr:uncharacterized protein BZA05DRAFT_405183 [Tricharina praecox]KAI5847552.1 hypothetical protein BZA05DRAFT_405183 [Tricharina praecox]
MLAESGMQEKPGPFLFGVASVACAIWAACCSSSTSGNALSIPCGATATEGKSASARRRKSRRAAQALMKATAVANQIRFADEAGLVDDYSIFWKWGNMYADELQTVLAMVVAVSAFLHINTVGGHHAAVVAEIVTAASLTESVLAILRRSTEPATTAKLQSRRGLLLKAHLLVTSLFWSIVGPFIMFGFYDGRRPDYSSDCCYYYYFVPVTYALVVVFNISRRMTMSRAVLAALPPAVYLLCLIFGPKRYIGFVFGEAPGYLYAVPLAAAFSAGFGRPRPLRSVPVTPEVSDVRKDSIGLDAVSDAAEFTPVREAPPATELQEITTPGPVDPIAEEYTMVPGGTPTLPAPVEQGNTSVDPPEAIIAATVPSPQATEATEPDNSPTNADENGYLSDWDRPPPVPYDPDLDWGTPTTITAPTTAAQLKNLPHSWMSWTECYDDYCLEHYATKNSCGRWPKQPWSRRRKEPKETEWRER